jgi:hypothetical protein
MTWVAFVLVSLSSSASDKAIQSIDGLFEPVPIAWLNKQLESWQAVRSVSVTLRSVLLAGWRRVGDMGECGDLPFCGDSGGCNSHSNCGRVSRRTGYLCVQQRLCASKLGQAVQEGRGWAEQATPDRDTHCCGKDGVRCGGRQRRCRTAAGGALQGLACLCVLNQV